MADETEIESAYRLNAKAQLLDAPGHRPFIVVPDGMSVQDIGDFLDRPARIKDRRIFSEVDALARYHRRFGAAETIAFSYPEASKIRVIFDYHGEEPSHCDHEATFAARFSDAYAEWRAISKKAMKQLAAGEFLEERHLDIVEPAAADIMDMVMQFDALKRVEFKSSQRLSDGMRQFTYTEESEARGNVTLPEFMKIRVPVYDGQDPTTLIVRIRYRIDDGQLTFSFIIANQKEVEAAAFHLCETSLAELCPDLMILRSLDRA